MNLFAVTSFLCGVFCLVLSFFAFIAGKNHFYRRITFFYFVVSIWGFGCTLVGISQYPQQALLAWKIAHSGGFFVAPAFFHFVHSICEKKKNFFVRLGYFQAVFFNLFFMAATPETQELRQAFGFFYLNHNALLTAADLFFAFYSILSYVYLYQYVKVTEGYKKKRAQYVSIGCLFGFLGGMMLLLPEFHIDVVPVGNFGVFISSVILTYVLLRTKVFDLDELVQLAHRDKLAAIGTLATCINHEVRNPLYIIQGTAQTYLERLEENSYASPAEALHKSKEVLTKALEQSSRAMDIVKRFAMFAKQNIDQEFKKENLVFEEVLENVLLLVQYELTAGKISFEKKIAPGLQLFCDLRHLEEILFNLIVNACQAIKLSTKERGLEQVAGKIMIEAREAGGQVEIKIEDNGPGIPPELLPKIFDPFYTSKTEGTGLGLYIVKQLVERSGGKITVQSKPGRGTTFKLEFRR